METVYYNLDARRVSAGALASGETSPRRDRYAVLRKVEEKRVGTGKVLDLEAYRRKLEGEVVETRDEQECCQVAPSAPVCRPARRRRLGLTLDFFATLAILVMASVVVMGFLPLL